MKRFLLAASIPVLSMCFSAAYANYNISYEGPYVGASVGSALMTASPGLYSQTIYNNITTQGGALNTLINQQNIMKGNVFRGDIFAGYGFAWQQLSLSAEIFLELQHYKETQYTSVNGNTSFFGLTYNTYNITTVQIKPWHSGLDFRPGFILNPASLIYARVGFSFNNVKLTSRTNFYTADPRIGETNLQKFLLSKNRNKVALRLGAGLEEHVTDELSIRADYVFTDYGRLSLDGTSGVLELPSFNSKQINLKTAGRVIDNALMISMLYSFC